jgi:hypothetical protein
MSTNSLQLLQSVQNILQQSLALPQLSYSDIFQFKQQLSVGLKTLSPVLNSVFLGAQVATPGMAFLSGYQNAIRCLDPACPIDEFAAFCVSEKGVKSPWDMESKIIPVADGYCLSGQKGFVMLLPHELDRLYVIAKSETNELKCVFVSREIVGLEVTESLNAPFIKDIPHRGVRFSDVQLSSSQVLAIDGHYEANKPFRYWEDIHVTISMLAWMLRHCREETKIIEKRLANNELASNEFDYNRLGSEAWDEITGLITQLIEQFENSSEYYSIDAFSLFDDATVALEKYSILLSGDALNQWKTDSALLLMGQKIRQLVQEKLFRTIP